MSEDNIPATTSDLPEGDPRLELPAGMFVQGPEMGQVGIEIVQNGMEVVEPLSFTVQGNFAFFEGDILIATTEELSKPIPKGLVRKGENFRWPGGVLVYVVEDPAVQERVDLALAHWTRRTPMTFRKRTNETDFVAFVDQGGCFSAVGRQGGRQVISLAPGCSVGATIHEIGHALGLWHEQSRGDRDTFITVRLENVNPQFRHNFAKHVIDGTMVGDYDYNSIMHYPATAFSTNGQPTIVPTQPGVQIGQRQGLSQGDLRAIKAIYPNLDWTNFPIERNEESSGSQ
jgi:hypothetical protein